MERRRLLGLVGGAALWALTGGRAVAAGREIPDETAGPFPGDGSNGGPNVLNRRGIVRRDIRRSFGSARGRAEGVETTLRLTVTRDAVPLKGAAVYVWQCDREAKYSLYDPGVRGENYLRGVQVADAEGMVEFASVFPGVYPGRWPHVHIEVYPNLRTARRSGDPLKTTQLAFPEAACREVYATAGYERSVANLRGVSLERDSAFGDGHDQQVGAATGNPREGYTVELDLPL